MNRAHSTSALHFYTLFIIAALVAMQIVAVSCRDKDVPVGPNGETPGEWSIVLEDTTTLYYTDDGSTILGDTIDVRLFDQTGGLAVGKTLRFAAEFDVNSITAFASTVDTLSLSYGCNPALYYWGVGTGDQENRTETIRAYYIEDGDTLAHAVRSYSIEPRQ